MEKTEGKFALYITKIQIRTSTLLKVFNLLIDLLIQLIKQDKETAELIIIPRRVFQGHLIASLYKNSIADFF